jgi:hypothetical protein
MTSSAEIFRKQLQILKEAVPKATRIAMLSNPVDPSGRVQERETESRSARARPRAADRRRERPGRFFRRVRTMKRKRRAGASARR